MGHDDIHSLAKEGKAKRIKKEKERNAFLIKSADKAKRKRMQLDQQRVFKHITKWHSLYKGSSYISIFLTISLIPLFFGYFLMLDGDGNWWEKLPHQKWLLAFPFVYGAILFFKANRNNKVYKEKLWIEKLPFTLKGYPDFFVYRSYSVFYVTLVYEKDTPDINFIFDSLSTLPYEIKIDEGEEGAHKFEVKNPKGSKFDWHRRWAYRWLHEACDVHFKLIHEKYPIKEVVIGNGTNELEFDWWISLPKALGIKRIV